MKKYEDHVLIYLDLETTGLSPFKHEIFEIAMVANDERFSELVRTKVPMHIQKITSISQKMVDDLGDTPCKVCAKLCTWLANLGSKQIWIGHNMKLFDMPFLALFIARYWPEDQPLPKFDLLVDTLIWSRKLNRPKHSLSVLYKQCTNTEIVGAHRALQDALAVKSVLESTWCATQLIHPLSTGISYDCMYREIEERCKRLAPHLVGILLMSHTNIGKPDTCKSKKRKSDDAHDDKVSKVYRPETDSTCVSCQMHTSKYFVHVCTKCPLIQSHMQTK